MLTAILESAHRTTAKIRAIRNLMVETTERVRKDAPAIYSREIVELIFTQPYSRIANVVEAGWRNAKQHRPIYVSWPISAS